MKRNWAITGATGFIGRHLLQSFSKRIDLHLTIFDQRRHSLAKPKSLVSLVKGKEVIFHLAAKTKGEDKELEAVNVTGTKNLLEVMVQSAKKGAKIVFTSSFAVYQPREEKRLIKEKDRLGPRNHYGVSKLEGEKLIEQYVKKHGLGAVILRFSSIYGPGCPLSSQSLVSTLAAQVNQGEAIEIWGDGEQKKDIVYVADAITALIKAAEYQAESLAIFNICAGKEVSVNRILDILEKIKGTPVKKNYLLEKAVAVKEYWIGSNQKAKRLLDWLPETELEEGLLELVKSLA